MAHFGPHVATRGLPSHPTPTPHRSPAPQGRLKRPVSFDDLVCGSWFERPLQLPGSFLVEAVIHWMASRWGDGRGAARRRHHQTFWGM
jgi:hypothetical protein